MFDRLVTVPSWRTAVPALLGAGLLGAALLLAIYGKGGNPGIDPVLLLIPAFLLGFYFGPLIGAMAGFCAAFGAGVFGTGLFVDTPLPAHPLWPLDLVFYVGLSTLFGLLSMDARRGLMARRREERRARQQAWVRLQSAPVLIQEERLRAQSQMASGVVHDISNTLVPVASFTELILETPELLEDRDRVMGYVRAMNMAAYDARRILSRLRDFHRPYEESPVSGPVDLNGLVGEVLSLTQPRWEAMERARGVTINAITDLQDIPPVSGSDADLREVLMNLIFNAIDAMPDGGSLRLSTQRRGDMCCLIVEDTGDGMTPEVLAKAAEPFFTTKGDGGTGMGLTIATGIVEAYGGRIEIESVRGKGTRVTVLMSVYQEDQGAEYVQAVAAALDRPLHVLVVDDSPSALQVLSEYLRLDGHQVRTAEDGEDGLRIALADRFDIIIVDAALPKLSGFQMAEAVTREQPACRIIMMSGLFAGLSESQDLQRLDGTSYVLLNKPCTRADLRKALALSMLG